MRAKRSTGWWWVVGLALSPVFGVTAGCQRLETLLPLERTVVAVEPEGFVQAAFPGAEPADDPPALRPQGVWRSYQAAGGRSVWLQIALWPDAETARSRFFATVPAHLYTFEELTGGEAFAAGATCQVRFHNLVMILTASEASRDLMVEALDALLANFGDGRGLTFGEAVEPPEIDLRRIYQGRDAPLAERACLVFAVPGVEPEALVFAGGRRQPRQLEDGLYESCVEAASGEPTLRVAKTSGEITELSLSQALARKVPVFARP